MISRLESPNIIYITDGLQCLHFQFWSYWNLPNQSRALAPRLVEITGLTWWIYRTSYGGGNNLWWCLWLTAWVCVKIGYSCVPKIQWVINWLLSCSSNGEHTRFVSPMFLTRPFFFIFVGVAHYIPRKDPQYDWFCSSILWQSYWLLISSYPFLSIHIPFDSRIWHHDSIMYPSIFHRE